MLSKYPPIPPFLNRFLLLFLITRMCVAACRSVHRSTAAYGGRAEFTSGGEPLTVGAGIQTLVPCKSGKGSSPLWESSLQTQISPIFNMLLQGQVFMCGFSWW